MEVTGSEMFTKCPYDCYDYPPGKDHISHLGEVRKIIFKYAIFGGYVIVPWRVCNYVKNKIYVYIYIYYTEKTIKIIKHIVIISNTQR